MIRRDGESQRCDILISEGRIKRVGTAPDCDPACEVIDAERGMILPGLVDVHVHLREP